jgi:Fic family protein
MNYDKLLKKKKLLDSYRPLPAELVINLDSWFRVELTYTSNALEGNALTRRETALVVEKGITVGGKSLVEHLEATNHAKALDWVIAQVKEEPCSLTQKDILHIHEVVLKGIDDDNSGHYRRVPVRISGSTVILPNPRKVPDLMSEFIEWLHQADKLNPVELAGEAHYRLVSIHPFVDGNGRTGRLLMNMILLMSGFPAAIIRKRDRLAYITSLENPQLGGSKNDYLKLIEKAVDRSLNIYLSAMTDEAATFQDSDDLFKIGELVKKTRENHSTLRHWTKLGLIKVVDLTKAGYQLYDNSTVEQVKKIQALKSQRFTLKEIKEKLRW